MSKQTPEATKRYRELNRERICAYLREYNKRPEMLMTRYLKRRVCPESQLLTNAKVRARKFHLDFNIDITDIVIPETCPILDIPLFIGEGKAGPNSPTLDRVHPNRGYIKGNVRVISHRANSMKQNNTVEDLKRFIRYMEGEL